MNRQMRHSTKKGGTGKWEGKPELSAEEKGLLMLSKGDEKGRTRNNLCGK